MSLSLHGEAQGSMFQSLGVPLLQWLAQLHSLAVQCTAHASAERSLFLADVKGV